MIEEFKIHLTAMESYSRRKADTYGNDLVTFVHYIKAKDANKRWSTITREDVDAYILYLSNNGHKTATLKRNLAAITGIYKYMQRKGLKVVAPYE